MPTGNSIDLSLKWRHSVKKNNLVLTLVVWPHHNLKADWNTGSMADIQSIRLAIRLIDTERKDFEFYIKPAKQVAEVAIRICAFSSGYNIELQAHNVYSSTASQLTELARWLRNAERKITSKHIRDNNIRNALKLTLNAIGIKHGVPVHRHNHLLEVEPLDATLNRLHPVLQDLQALVKEKP